MEALHFIEKFDVGLPTDTPTWTGGMLLIPEAASKPSDQKPPLAQIQEGCKELDVLVLNNQHCVAVTHVDGADTGQSTPYHISRFLKGGYTYVNPKKKTIPKESWELVSRLAGPNGRNDGNPPGSYALKFHRGALNRFLGSAVEVEEQLKPVLKKAAKSNVVMAMTMNAGMTDLVLNFVCSARRAGTAIDQLVLFPTDAEAFGVAQSLGVPHFTHPSFGDFPKEEAESYGDDTFVKMMWIKAGAPT
mmetsp:Transcript_49346/g.111989  ORF Transcript_49346/g.111989 Transcript_49346/m.111989 type:complete len:246 (-) Transcript_49346:953-1690(-)